MPPEDERPRLSVVRGGGDHHAAVRSVRETPPMFLHPSRRLDDTDRDKLSRVLALLNRWERGMEDIKSVDDRELLQAAIDSIREVVALPVQHSSPLDPT